MTAIDSAGARSRVQQMAARPHASATPLAQAQSDTVKIGVILPMTGPQASTGKQIDAAIKLWVAQNGNKAGGKKVEVIVKDDAGVADTSRRLAQELVVNEKVVALAGFGLTPIALATAPIATQSKTPMVVMAAATSMITEASPYIVRTSFTLAQSSTIIADWAAKNGIKKVATLTSDYAPGNDALTFFKQNFTAGGGEARVPGDVRHGPQAAVHGCAGRGDGLTGAALAAPKGARGQVQASRRMSARMATSRPMERP